uniref:H(+)/Pi cotransporter n=1 Tax=Musa acuminata subsp. malaccensis TaxID=214687 RepID=A0A804HNH3_MUSAM
MTLMLMAIYSIAIGLSLGHTAKGVMATLCLFRFWLGFGVGGDYLLSTTIMSEYAYKKTRGAFIAVVFTTQGVGILTGGIVSIIISAAFKERFDYPAYRDECTGSTVPEADYIWCTTLMLGALPVALTYYWRMKMPETARYTALVAKNAERATPECRGIIRQTQACSPLTSGSIGLMRSQLVASLPRPLGLMRSQHAASLPRPLSLVRSQHAASLPRPLGLMRSQHAASPPRPLGHMRSQHAARCLGHSATCAANTLPQPARLGSSAPRAQLGPTRSSVPSARPARVPRPLGPLRSKQCAASASASCAASTLPCCLAASATWPRAQPASSLAALATRPHAQPARCLGLSASCAFNTLPPRPLGLMRSKQHAASAPRPHAQPTHYYLSPSASCAVRNTLPRPLGLVRSQHAASLPRPLDLIRSRQAASLPRPLGLMRSQHAASPTRPRAQPARSLAASATRPHAQLASSIAASATRPHAQPTRCLGHSASCAANTLPRCLGHSASCAANTLPRPLGLMRSLVAS